MSKIYRLGDRYYVRFWSGGKEYRRATGGETLREATKLAKAVVDEVRKDAGPDDLYARALVKDGLTPAAGESIRDQVVRHLAAKMAPASLVELAIIRYRAEEASKQEPRTQRRIRADRTAMARRLAGEQSERIAVDDVFTAWQTAPKKREPGKSTVEGMYRPICKRFAQWAKGRGRTYLHEITESDALSYFTYLKEQGFSPRTMRADRTLLKAIWSALTVQAGLADVWGKTPLPESEHGIRDAFTPAEVGKLFAAAADAEEKALIGLGLYAGLRLGDAATLPLSAVDYTRGIIELRPRKTAKRHGTIARIPILPPLRSLLDDVHRRKGSPYVLPRLGHAYRANPSTIQDVVKQLFERADIATSLKRETGRKRARSLGAFHRLRHSFISACARAGMPPAAVRQMTGHTTAAVQQLYEHIPDADLIRAAAALPAMVEEKP